ncbi:transposase, MuDR, MULE transposase domain protein [Tanacetum coccineum]
MLIRWRCSQVVPVITGQHEIGDVSDAEELHSHNLDEEALERRHLEEQTWIDKGTRAKVAKENVFILDPDGALMSTQEYMQKVVEDVGEDADFNSGTCVSATNYVNAFGGTVTGCLGDIDNFLKKGKLEQVVANSRILDVGSYEKDITVGAAMILANVSVFTPKPSKHYLNITKRNVVEVFRKDTISLA